MTRVVAAILFASVFVIVCGCAKETTYADHVAAELEGIPVTRPPSAVFADFRARYEESPDKWDEASIRTLLEFRPKSDWEAEEFLQFVMFLANEYEPMCARYLETVHVIEPDGGTVPLPSLLKLEDESKETFFENYKVTTVDVDDQGTLTIGIQQGRRR